MELRQQCIDKNNCAPNFYAIKNHQENKWNLLNVGKENMLQKISSVSISFKPPWFDVR